MQAQYLSKDPGYLSCKKKECKKYVKGRCEVRTCSASLSFHVVNFRTDIEFVLFAGGFATPCILKTSQNKLSFNNPKQPLYGHLSSIDSTATSVSTPFFYIHTNVMTSYCLMSQVFKVEGSISEITPSFD